MADMNDATGHPSDEMMAAFLDGGLSEAEREDVMAHLAECDECREFVADWARVAAASTGERGYDTERVGVSPVKVIKPDADTQRKEPRTKQAVPISDCPHCHMPVVAGGRFCTHCGMDATKASITCANCGKKVASADTFCRICGAPLTAEGLPASPEKAFIVYENGSLIAGIISFILSFFVHSFFWQFLIAFGAFMGFYVYFRMKREVMIELIDALRSGDKSKEEEIMQRLRRRFKA